MRHLPLPLDSKIISGQLDNGLRYLISPNQKPLSRAELRLVVRAGSVLEDEDQRGLAHIVEHMAFNGTKRFESGELVKYFESIGMKFGAHLNAYTSFDETVYSLHIPTEEEMVIDRALEILRDWCADLTFPEDQIERERKVGLEEWRQSRGAGSRAADVIIPKLYHGTRYADRLPIGTEESLRGFSHEALKRFYKTWYRPELIGVVVVGDLNARQMEEKIKASFSDLRSDPEAPLRALDELPAHEETLVEINVDAELTRSTLCLLTKVPSREDGTQGAYRDQMVEQITQMAFNDRLSRLSQQPNAPFMGAYCYDQRLNYSTMGESLAAFIPQGKYKECAIALFKEMSRLKRYGLTDAELKRSKLRVSSSIESSYHKRETTSSEQLTDELVRHYLNGEPVPGIEYEHQLTVEILPEISLEEVNTYLSQWMPKEGRLLHLMTCDEDAPSATELVEWLNEAEEAEVSPPTLEEELPPLLTERPTQGQIVSRERIEELDIEVLTLSNDIEVWIKSTDYQKDSLWLTLYQQGGYSHVGVQDLVAARTAQSIASKSGVAELNRDQLKKTLSGKRITAQPMLNKHEHGFMGFGSPRYLETLFQVNYLKMTAPRFDQLAFRRDQELREEALRNKLNQPEAIMDDEETRLWWAGDPHHTPLTLAQLSEMDLERSASIYRETMSGLQGSRCFIVGDLDDQHLEELITRYLGQPTSPPIEPKVYSDPRPTEIIQHELFAGIEPVARYSMLSITRAKIPVEERVALQALRRVLDVRLRQSLRDERGDVYGVGIGQQFNLHPVETLIWNLKFSCDPQKIDELSKLALDHLANIAESTSTADELENVKRQMLKDYEVKLRENRMWVSHLTKLHQRGEDPRIILDRPQIIDRLSPEALSMVAEKYINLNHRLEMKLLPQK